MRFLGYLKDDTLTVLYRLASVFVFLALRRIRSAATRSDGERHSIVTSNVSSLPEVTGDAAVLVDPYDVDSIAMACAASSTIRGWQRN